MFNFSNLDLFYCRMSNCCIHQKTLWWDSFNLSDCMNLILYWFIPLPNGRWLLFHISDPVLLMQARFKKKVLWQKFLISGFLVAELFILCNLNNYLAIVCVFQDTHGFKFVCILFTQETVLRVGIHTSSSWAVVLLGMQVLGVEVPLAAGSCSSTGNTPERNPRRPPFPPLKLKAKCDTVRPR